VSKPEPKTALDYRREAERVRRKAETVKDAVAHRLLFNTAQTHEDLAVSAEKLHALEDS
jgi:hypothetical protein